MSRARLKPLPVGRDWLQIIVLEVSSASWLHIFPNTHFSISKKRKFERITIILVYFWEVYLSGLC